MRGMKLRLVIGILLFLTAQAVGLIPSTAAYARPDKPATSIGFIAVADLPPEARETLKRIKAGGPHPYKKDGTVFSNRERILPRQPRGFYLEFTVKTPGSRDRGARRIVSGGDPKVSGEYYYTDDHYNSFKRIKE